MNEKKKNQAYILLFLYEMYIKETNYECDQLFFK